MTVRRYLPVFAIALLLIVSGITKADTLPIAGATSQVATGLSGVWTVTLGTTGASSGTGASASADLTTGELKLATQGTTGPGATVMGFEFLTFSSNANVSYGYALNGSLNNANANGAVELGGQVLMYDVTGLSPNFFTHLSNGFEFVSSGSPIAGSSSKETILYGSGFSPTDTFGSPLPANIDFLLSQDGSAVPVTMNITGTFGVQANHLYILDLILAAGDFGANGVNQQGVDFSHTAAFNFTDLGGATFQSASGAFLSQVPAAAPEISSLAMLTAGLLALGLTGLFVRARTSSTSSARA